MQTRYNLRPRVLTKSQVKHVMAQIHKEKRYRVAPSSVYDYVGYDLCDYWFHGKRLDYRDHDSEAIHFSKVVQHVIEKTYILPETTDLPPWKKQHKCT